MHTITFYSYKGGVGRTLALANIAVYLSKFEQRICIMDFDLEAPGLHYKFPKYIKPDDIKQGLVDYISHFTSTGTVPNSIKEFSKQLTPQITLIPAGNPLSSSYWQKLSSIDWHKLFYSQGGEGIPFFLELKEKINQELKPDFLLIDSRTGVTETSGVCTSILPDRVVFIITNNSENISGARQILRGLHRTRKVFDQPPIEVSFALARIPYSKDDEGGKAEKKIRDEILSFLNEDTVSLDSHPVVKGISILHSDPQLELSETLRISQDGVTEENPLVSDYLRLFSMLVPEAIIKAKLGKILDMITSSEKLLSQPEKVQRELEDLAQSYPHPRTLEKLIEFYILRNVRDEKLRKAFHTLFRTSSTIASDILSKYANYFVEQSYYNRNFDLEKIEVFLKSNPERVDVRMKLADAYAQNQLPSISLQHLSMLLDQPKTRQEVLSKMLGIYSNTDQHEEAVKLWSKYHNDFAENTDLKIKKIRFIIDKGDINEVLEVVDADAERLLAKKDPDSWARLLSMTDRTVELQKELGKRLQRSIRKGDERDLFETGRLYYSLGMEATFRAAVNEIPWTRRILDELDSRYERRHFR